MTDAANGDTGEYFLSATTHAYASTSVSGDVFNDLLGGGVNYGYPGLNGWEIDLYDATAIWSPRSSAIRSAESTGRTTSRA